MPQRNLLLLVVATIVAFVCYAQGEQDPYCRFTSRGVAAIQTNSFERVPGGELFQGAMKGMVDVLRQHGDAHSQYFNPTQARSLRTEINQQFGGIGIRLNFRGTPPQLTIFGPIEPESPAGKAKLSPGDRIFEIDGHSTRDMELADALKHVRGEPGTILRLSVARPTEKNAHDVELKREIVPMESVCGDRRDADGHWIFTLPDDSRIAVVRIVSFGDQTAFQLQKYLQKLTADGVHSVVLDLRDNAGGSLTAAAQTCQMLLPANRTIVETQGRDHAVHEHYATKVDGPFCKLSLAVLVNGGTASASEIVAACLQDNHRAVVVGQRSFGKGTVQQMLPLESGRSLLKLTWASFWRPGGANIHRASGAPESEVWGVSPDIGFERVLSADEAAAYEAFRRERDESDANPPSDKSQYADFRDEQLQLGGKYLAGKLGATGHEAAGGL